MRSIPSYPKLYEVNTRVWLRRFDSPGRAAGLNQVPVRVWDELKELGIHIVWLMGVWKTNPVLIGKYNFAPHLIEAYRRALPDWKEGDVVGSPYAIDDYEASPALGGFEALEGVREQLHRRGMLLMLDFIPNHFGAESPLIRSHPEVFLQGSEALRIQDPDVFYKPEGSDTIFAHGRDPYFPAWSDTAQVNYCSETARGFMIQRLLRVANRCDGVRCDMGMLVLNDPFWNTWNRALVVSGWRPLRDEFWPGAISEVKSRFPGFIFMAEAYWGTEGLLQQQGFDYTYDKALTDALKADRPDTVRRHLAAPLDHQRRMVRFLENHDEERAAAAYGKSKSLAAAVIVSTTPGLRLYHDGQFEGREIRLPLQLGREPYEPVDPQVRSFYERLLGITREPIFALGEWRMLETSAASDEDASHRNMLAWIWEYENRRRLVVVNLSDSVSRGRLILDVRQTGRTVQYTDLLSGRSFQADRGETQDKGLTAECGPYGSLILAI